MVVDPEVRTVTLSAMPGPSQRRLTPAQARRLEAAAARIDRSRKEWAAVVRQLGVAPCARELGITPQALSERLKRIERGK